MPKKPERWETDAQMQFLVTIKNKASLSTFFWLKSAEFRKFSGKIQKCVSRERARETIKNIENFVSSLEILTIFNNNKES